MNPTMIAEAAQKSGRLAPGSVLFTDSAYDRRRRRCRVYAVADGVGGMEWRVVREGPDGGSDGEVEVCFHSYAEVLRWLA
jgi:hypothetical protein